MKPGDTLLSIIEREEGSLTQPIETIVTDFQELNEGLKPEKCKLAKHIKSQPIQKKLRRLDYAKLKKDNTSNSLSRSVKH